jgi:uncharacterized membrane protein
MKKVIDSQLSTISKTVVYRILCTIGIALLTLGIGGTGAQAGIMALISIVIGLTVYYLHDRAWNLVSWKRDETGRESVVRSIVKTIVYRILIMIAVVLVVELVITNDTSTAVAFAIGNFVINLTLYYIVERVANRIEKGRMVVNSKISGIKSA